MAKQKQEIPLSFKISNSLAAAIEEERGLEIRSQSDMAKILIAEAVLVRKAKRNIDKLL